MMFLCISCELGRSREKWINRVFFLNLSCNAIFTWGVKSETGRWEWGNPSFHRGKKWLSWGPFPTPFLAFHAYIIAVKIIVIRTKSSEVAAILPFYIFFLPRIIRKIDVKCLMVLRMYIVHGHFFLIFTRNYLYHKTLHWNIFVTE